MPETIPGGAYQSPDGTWVDANGKPISERAVRQFLSLQAEQPPAPIVPPAAPVPPVSTVTAAVPRALPPEEPPQIGEETDETPKRSRRSRS